MIHPYQVGLSVNIIKTAQILLITYTVHKFVVHQLQLL